MKQFEDQLPKWHNDLRNDWHNMLRNGWPNDPRNSQPLLAEDLRYVFATDRRDDTPEKGWKRWQAVCEKWKGKYRRFATLKNELRYQASFTYLNYDPRMRSMIYTTNWIERLNKDFRRVLKARNSMPDEDSVITLLGHVAIDKRCYRRKVPKLKYETNLFPPMTDTN